MNYQKIECNEYNIHLINNKKFHTIDFRIYFTDEVSLENITYYNFLVSILTYATKKYDTKEKLIKKCQDLYSLSPTAQLNRNGNLVTCKFGISTVNSKYIPKDNLYDNIILLKEILLNPLVSDNKFNEKYFNATMKELENETKTIPEEPRLLANLTLLDLLNRNSGNIMSSYCDLDVLSQITRENLYQKYLEFIHNSKIDIFISGNISDPESIVKFIQDNFIFNNKSKKLKEGLIHHDKESKIVVKEEYGNYSQSKISIGYKLYNVSDFENRYVAFVFNHLVGGGANSLLMRYIREEKSLCYYIDSFYNRLDNIIVINSGINKKNYEEVLKLQKEVFKNVLEGKFTNNDLNDAKEELYFDISNIDENNRSIIEYYYGRSLFNSDDINYKIKMIRKVTKEDIIKFTKKLKLDAIYFLKGDL